MSMSSRKAPWLFYLTTLLVCLAVIAFSIGTIGQASVGMMQRADREKSPVDLQIESAREIRAALKKPIVPPPLPPVTAKPLRDVSAVAAADQSRRLPANARPAAMNAMAMDQPASRGAASYPGPDRHALQ